MGKSFNQLNKRNQERRQRNNISKIDCWSKIINTYSGKIGKGEKEMFAQLGNDTKRKNKDIKWEYFMHIPRIHRDIVADIILR